MQFAIETNKYLPNKANQSLVLVLVHLIAAAILASMVQYVRMANGSTNQNIVHMVVREAHVNLRLVHHLVMMEMHALVIIAPLPLILAAPMIH
jgi:hypothetical protein